MGESTIGPIIMKYLGFAMIFGAIASPGISSAMSINKTKEQVNKLQTQYDDLEKQWDDIFKQDAEINNDITNSISNQLDTINQTMAQTLISHKNFQEQNQKIQYFGVIFIVFVFFLLLLKQYDLYDFIFSPFSKK